MPNDLVSDFSRVLGRKFPQKLKTLKL